MTEESKDMAAAGRRPWGNGVWGVIFYGLVTPVGVVLRALGWDPLQLRWPPRRASGWETIDRP